MAINIQEILHPSDSDSIKFSKINYNFDQILANGGGPVGPKGQKGIQGVVGQTGQKGEIGEKGIKGDSGETTSPWKSITIDLDALDGKNNLTILKPKPGTDIGTPTIWLGDSSFINDGNTAGDGDVSLRSTLNVGRHYDFDNSTILGEYITLWHNADNKIKIDSEDQTGYVRYNISPVQPLVGSAPDIRLQINTPTIHTETFQLSNQAATGTLESGMIRYNAGGNKFEGYINNAWVEFCMDPCGSGVVPTIEISGGDINAQANGAPVGDSISVSGGDINANANGSPVGSLPLPVITNFDAYALAGYPTEIECYWDSISDSTDVTITWGTGGSFTNGGSATITSYGSDTYTITGLTANTAYSIRMTATNATGNDVEERTATTAAASYQHTLSFDVGSAQTACGSSTTYTVWSDDQTLNGGSVFWTDSALSEWSETSAPYGWYSNGTLAWLITNPAGGYVTTTDTCATSPSEQQYTISFNGNSLNANNWSITSMLLNPSYAGSASNPSWSYNTASRQGTLMAVAGDTLRFNIGASAGSGLQFSSGSPFSIGGGTIELQQVDQNNTDGGLEIQVVLPMTGVTDNVTLEALTESIPVADPITVDISPSTILNM